jgi:integrase
MRSIVSQTRGCPMKLTQRIVDDLKPGTRCFVWDDALPRFGVRVTADSLTYIVDCHIGRSQRRRVSVGATRLFSLTDARAKAREIIVGGRQGRDVTVDPRLDQPTFSAVWRRMIDNADKERLAPATIDDYEDRARRLILPRLGQKRIGAVTTADVEETVTAAGGARNRAYIVALIKKTVNFAKRARLLGEDHRNPAADVVVKHARKTGRAIDSEDIKAFGAALATMEAKGSVSPWLAGLFRLSLICGLRPGEVRTLKWAAVNIPKARMTVRGKTGEREIHLTEAAISVLSSTPRVQGCEFVFAGRRFGEPIVAVYKSLAAVQARAGISRFRPYDFRHTAATGALASGADVRAVQALLGHSDLKTTAGYLHATEKRRAAAAELASTFGRAILRDEKFP